MFHISFSFHSVDEVINVGTSEKIRLRPTTHVPVQSSIYVYSPGTRNLLLHPSYTSMDMPTLVAVHLANVSAHAVKASLLFIHTHCATVTIELLVRKLTDKTDLHLNSNFLHLSNISGKSK